MADISSMSFFIRQIEDLGGAVFHFFSPTEALSMSWHPPTPSINPYCLEGGRNLDKLVQSKA
jgi:hypothetical protein